MAKTKRKTSAADKAKRARAPKSSVRKKSALSRKKTEASGKETIKKNLGRANLKPGALLAPLPAVMVTVGSGDEANIITIGWCGILSTDPPRAYISVRPSRHSYAKLLANREFVINLTTESLCRHTDYAGIYTGAKVDKFSKLGLSRVESKEVNAPTIAESPLSLECRVFDIIKSGTHDIFLSDIVNVSCSCDIIDEKGRICLDRAGLITYSHGEYFALGKKLGNFGFSATKATKVVKEKK